MTLLRNKTIPKFYAPLCKITKRKHPASNFTPTGNPKRKKSKSTCAKTSRPKITNLSAIRTLPSGVLRGTVCFRRRGTRRKRKGAVLEYCPLSLSSMTLLRNKTIPKFYAPLCKITKRKHPASNFTPTGNPKRKKSKSTCAKTSRPKITNLSAIRTLPSGVLRGTVCFRRRGTRRKRKGAVLEYCPLSFSSMTLLRNKTSPAGSRYLLARYLYFCQRKFTNS